MLKTFRLSLALIGLTLGAQSHAQIALFEYQGFAGRSYNTRGTVANLERSGLDNRAMSVIVDRKPWELCEDVAFRGRCSVLRPGRYRTLDGVGLGDRISSVRPVDSQSRTSNDRFAPQPLPVYDDRRRQGERLYQARVTLVRAVVESQSRRCWIEREEVQRDPERDLATVGGALAGAAVGSNLGRDSNGPQEETRNLQRCSEQGTQGRVAYWDVTYEFRGQEHHMQALSPPGATITVNRMGEPRS